MDAPLDLYRASREELIAAGRCGSGSRSPTWSSGWRRHEAEVATLRATHHPAQRTRRRAAGGPRAGAEATSRRRTRAAMPGLKPTAPRVRRRPAAAAAEAPGARVWAAADAADGAPGACLCPLSALRHGAAGRHRQAHAARSSRSCPPRSLVTEHVYLERRCPRCGGRWLPGPELAGVVVGQRRLGVGLLSLIAVLREELRLPIARHPVVSAGGAWAAPERGGDRGGAAHRWRSGPRRWWRSLREAIRASPGGACR